MSGFLVFVLAIISLAGGAISWFLTPKGPNQTLIRTSLMLAITCCYLMWAITYMAQLHPLMAPRRGDVRSGPEGL
ncbi:H(+)-transporting V0 sector ATPase subunit e [Naganishia albida]|nr:H(+)-transporting V0 sector ATPase subunit e [Naganishia albida]